MPESLVLLHGFSGTRHAWDARRRAAAPANATCRWRSTCPGTARPPRSAPITFDSCVAQRARRSPERFALCGYSLGGRVALHVALAAPERVTRLVLVSTSAGIEDDAERAERRAADRRLADELERIPFEQFIERWRTQPLFADDPPEVGALAREDQRRNRPARPRRRPARHRHGEMEPLWDRLGSWRCP